MDIINSKKNGNTNNENKDITTNKENLPKNSKIGNQKILN